MAAITGFGLFAMACSAVIGRSAWACPSRPAMSDPAQNESPSPLMMVTRTPSSASTSAISRGTASHIASVMELCFSGRAIVITATAPSLVS